MSFVKLVLTIVLALLLAPIFPIFGGLMCA